MPGRRRVTIGRLYPGRVPRHRIGTPGRFGTTVLQRQLPLPQFGFRLLFPVFRFPLYPMHVPHRGRSPVPARPGMEVLEGIEVLAPDAPALCEQGREFVRPGAEGLGLFQQHGMAGERLEVGSAERYGIAFGAGAFTQIVISCQNLPAAVGEGSDCPGMSPAEGGAPDIPRDAGQRVVVCRRTDIPHLAPGFAWGSAFVFSDILPTLFPHAIHHIVERRLLRLRARPAFGEIRPDLGIRHRRLPVVVGPPVGDVESERRPVDVDVEPLAMACRRGDRSSRARASHRPAGRSGPRSTPGPR